MANWTFLDIKQKVRQVTGRFSEQELDDDEISEYINRYYQYTFPAELKLERTHTYYTFLTEANQKWYNLPTGYTNFEPPLTVNNLSVLWYQDPSAFDENNPENYSTSTIGTGDGATTLFSTTLSGVPIQPASVIITDDLESFEDTNQDYSASPVTITGSLSGSATVNYSTGDISVTFNTAPASGQAVTISFIQYTAGRPTAVLMYNNQFSFYPTPDTVYKVRVKAYSNTLVLTNTGTTLTEFTNATDKPYLEQWGPCIAYGASRDIHSDKGEMDAYAEVTALYKEQLAYVLKRTNQNLLNTRAAPNF